MNELDEEPGAEQALSAPGTCSPDGNRTVRELSGGRTGLLFMVSILRKRHPAQPLFKEVFQFGLGEVQLFSLHQDRVDRIGEHLAGAAARHLGPIDADERSLAGAGADHARAFEFGVGARDRVAVHARLNGHVPDGVEAVSVPESSRGHRVLT